MWAACVGLHPPRRERRSHLGADMQQYDAIVIGTGQAGKPLATDLAGADPAAYKPALIALGGSNANDQFAKAEVAEVLIFDRVLTQSEIDDHLRQFGPDQCADNCFLKYRQRLNFGSFGNECKIYQTHAVDEDGDGEITGAEFACNVDSNVELQTV